MRYRRNTIATILASSLILACADAPVAPRSAAITPIDEGSIASVRTGNKHGASLSGIVQQTIGTNVIDAVVRITKISLAENGGLLVSGIISGTANGTAFIQAITDVPAELIRGGVGTMQGGGACDILALDLGPLHLDLLGLVVDLAPVVLDIVAQTGSGNLLGNLLCAVVRLLDGPGVFAAIGNLLDQINAILGALGA
jgi:hypothetical protein